MAINRLRLIQQKETAIAKQQRRGIAQLLEQGKEQSARIRVENIIREDINVELLEILELYCELLLARIGLLEARECDLGLEEAVKTVIHAAPRTEVKELHTVREILVHKYGKEFTQDAVDNTSGKVPEKVIKRLSVEPPSETLVTLYLVEIARAYQVPFSGSPIQEESNGSATLDGSDDDDEGPPSGRIAVPLADASDEISEKQRRLSQVANLPDPDAPSKSPISVAKPSPTTDNPRPVLKVVPQPIAKPKSKEDKELDDLRARFDALRKR
jgi:vacuolar protein sorting-associated protein IST1